jgi:hypothetical protein
MRLRCKTHEKRVMVIESDKVDSGMVAIHRQDGKHCDSRLLSIGGTEFVNRWDRLTDLPEIKARDVKDGVIRDKNWVARQLLYRIFGEL